MNNSITYTLAELEEVCHKLSSVLAGCHIVTLTGDLGAGKTTFLSSLLKMWGVPDGVVISPTFTYLNSYELPDGRMIYHFDLYRLKNSAEFESMGFFEYLDQSNSIVFIEWPGIINQFIKENICTLKFEVTDDGRRRIEWKIIKNDKEKT